MAFRHTSLARLDDAAIRREIGEALEAVDGNVVRAAHLLGISRRQLYRYLHGRGTDRGRGPGAWDEADRVRSKAMEAFLAARARLGVNL